MAGEIIIQKPTAKRTFLERHQQKSIDIKPGTGGSGSRGVTFSVEDGHILVLSGKVSVENNDTIVL